MNINEMRHDLLERFLEECNDNLIPAGMVEATEEGEPETVEFVLMDVGDAGDEARGFLYFDPMHTPEDEVQHLTCLITLQEDLPEGRLPLFYQALAHINFTLPYGCFSIDTKNRFLAYKLCVPIAIEMTGEELYDEINIVTGNAAEAVDTYMGVLSDIRDGSMDLENVLEFLGG
ncbi:MAG: hypothetical protein K5853_05555 [Lachnospiraceae bacterium]|nr:hypothetical protein [Lachnospiraceae bacterium]